MSLFTNDKVSTGVLIGALLPIILVVAFLFYSATRCGSFMGCIEHFQLTGVLYKIVSVSLLPGAGLFFLWSKFNKLNQARGLLLVTLFYGIFVLILYMI
ncbi:MAG TPA: hypothetical protein DCQ26_05765 [Marinilabiliales bacterium]|jgi:hypothetical protein|nr:MAG: hypothetical protein A2W95_01000 [Bacteroidetes bacterium GWA2_40_14]OFX61882.1 MAG: hypothetical protein A2W84_12885 [Bacteroidetes bacterium GWC2_40_13]OFX74029.1 MAG: hypothetical protein A2W96_11995 [Bacteroidetes bacterium GWD2_40_43]OFX93136.1 MAG: hypothetical protein A2W97_06075 [Bacteroidetes bacterium GWE2_40_63]OFY21506.1 MAG: hypothetical protein A2W88_10075 [Bacteroidetes bacterium GWF2_40_13]OFZ24160.1 MAG: hypothetical protein A2437_17210 [Bacteroidetes bacterium RIFOXYC